MQPLTATPPPAGRPRPAGRWVRQAITAATLDDNAVPGDCVRAAVATVLGLPLADVPHAVLWPGHWLAILRAWTRTRVGLDWVAATRDPGTGRPLPLPVGPPALPLHIAWGPSPRTAGATHAVVLDQGGAVVWDPHPSDAGLPAVTGLLVPVAPYQPHPQGWAYPGGQTDC